MAGLGPAIHDSGSPRHKSWIPAPRAGMTRNTGSPEAEMIRLTLGFAITRRR